eukprot:scaffold297_cov164-Ochromonas_danica.AAC.11
MNKSKLDEEVEEKKVIEEIREMLEKSRADRARREKKRQLQGKSNRSSTATTTATTVQTPYGLYNPNKSSGGAVLRDHTRLLHRSQSHQSNCSNKITTAVLSSSSSSLAQTDAILHQYAEEMHNKALLNRSLPEKDFKIKTMTAAHMDTMMKVSAFLEINEKHQEGRRKPSDNYLRPTLSQQHHQAEGLPKTSSSSSPNKATTRELPRLDKERQKKTMLESLNLGKTTTTTKGGIAVMDVTKQQQNIIQQVTTNSSNQLRFVSANKFKRKYSRFCESMEFVDEDVKTLSSKRDGWMAKFMEICYDEAYALLSATTTTTTATTVASIEELGIERADKLKYSKPFTIDGTHKSSSTTTTGKIRKTGKAGELVDDDNDEDSGQFDSGRLVESYVILILFEYGRKKKE